MFKLTILVLKLPVPMVSTMIGARNQRGGDKESLSLSLRRLPQSEAKKFMRNVVAVVPLSWNLEQKPMMCGGGRGGESGGDSLCS